ncbi:MAG: hypothetical protein EBR62_05785 [Verrucomicrobia bacterium]|jgi:hypothetical protein|nr:hypothetical protein [Verrucomicrobiota bacterium]
MTAERKNLLRARTTTVPFEPSWRRDGFGGTLRLLWAHLLTSRGLLVSVGLHALLLLIAFVWVISVMKEQRYKQPEFMATGAGGGADGDRARILEHNLQLKKAKATAKTVSRITSKNPAAQISLPELPSSKLADTLNTKPTGSSSKGFGGGSGGGFGAGKGIGVGNARNFVGKPVMGAKINATKLAVFLDASRSMARYLDRVEAEIRKQFPDADVFLYSGIWTNVKDDTIIGGLKYKGSTGRTGSAPVRATDPDKLTATGKRIFSQYDANFRTGCVGAWLDIMRSEKHYDGIVIFSDFQDGVTQYRTPKGEKSDGYSTKNATIVYSDGMRSTLPTDERKPAEKRWEEDLVNAFAGAKAGRGPRLYLFSTQVEPQPIFNRCVLASGGQVKMVEWLRTGGNPPTDDEQVSLGKPTPVKADGSSGTPAAVRALR